MRTVWLLSSMALTAFLIAPLASAQDDSSPKTFEGKTLEGWLASLPDGHDPIRVLPALDVFGPEALTRLIRIHAQAKDPRLRGVVGSMLWSSGPDVADAHTAFAPALKDAKPETRGLAASCLAAMGAGAQPVVPELIASLEDKACDISAAMALGRIGAPAEVAIPALVAALESPRVRPYAARALERLGAATLPHLEPALTSKNPDVRQTAEWVRAWINDPKTPGPELRYHGQTVAQWIQRLNNITAKRNFNFECTQVLTHIGIPAVGPLFEASLDKGLGPVPRGSEYAIVQMGPAVFRPLSKLLARPDREGRFKAVHLLGRINLRRADAIPKDAIAAMLKTLDDPDPEVRRFMASAFNRPQAKAAVPALIARIRARKKDPDLALEAARALGGIGDASPAVVKALTGMVADLECEHSRFYCYAGAEALGRLGPAAQSAGGKLRKALFHSEGTVRTAASAALHQIGSNPAAHIKALKKGLKHKNIEIRVSSAESLGRLGPSAAPAIKSLVTATKLPWDPNSHEYMARLVPEVHLKSAEALGRIGAAAESAVPALTLLLLEHAHQSVRVTAAVALGRIGSKRGVKALRTALVDDMNPEVRKAAAEALARLEKK